MPVATVLSVPGQNERAEMPKRAAPKEGIPLPAVVMLRFTKWTRIPHHVIKLFQRLLPHERPRWEIDSNGVVFLPRNDKPLGNFHAAEVASYFGEMGLGPVGVENCPTFSDRYGLIFPPSMRDTDRRGVAKVSRGYTGQPIDVFEEGDRVRVIPAANVPEGGYFINKVGSILTYYAAADVESIDYLVAFEGTR